MKTFSLVLIKLLYYKTMWARKKGQWMILFHDQIYVIVTDSMTQYALWDQHDSTVRINICQITDFMPSDEWLNGKSAVSSLFRVIS